MSCSILYRDELNNSNNQEIVKKANLNLEEQTKLAELRSEITNTLERLYGDDVDKWKEDNIVYNKWKKLPADKQALLFMKAAAEETILLEDLIYD